ncbi:MAG: GDP-D-mannose dehydratase [uncultured bacterium]|nr:MAG: GDP-D-mannose dehydratase [uncultured bacterium]
MAKAAAFWEVANYRDAYNLHACTGILFNHESPLRPARFVTRKIISAACRIAAGSSEKLRLGNLDIERDWGWAPEYVEAMWQMLQQSEPSDFVIATGQSNKLSDFIEKAFSCVGLEWRDHVEIDPALFRPADLMVGRADPGRAERVLGWRAGKLMPDVVRLMMEVEQGKVPVQNL